MTFIAHFSDPEQTSWMKKSNCLCFKERNYTTYHFLTKDKITAISERVSKDKNGQGKDNSFWSL